MQHRLTIRFLPALLGFILLTASAGAQSIPSVEVDRLKRVLRDHEPDTGRVQLLLTLGAFYLSKTLDPKRDLDSALVLARQARILSQLLKHPKGAEEAALLEGKIQIKSGNSGAVLAMVGNVSDTNRIKLLLELGKHQLRPTYSRKGNRDSALHFFRQAERLSESLGSQKWKEESQSLVGVCHLLGGDWTRGKACFMQVIEARRWAGDKAGELKAWLRMATTTYCEDDCTQKRSWLAQALALSRQMGDQPWEALILLEMGNDQMDRRNTRQAEQAFARALAIQEAVGYPAICGAYQMLAGESVYLMPGDYAYLSNAYYLLAELGLYRGDLNKALFYLLQAVKSIERSGLTDELDYAYFRLGNIYAELGQFDKSTGYHQQSLAVSHRKGQVIVHIGLAKRMAVALLKAGKAREALALLQKVTRQDVPFTPEKKMIIAKSIGECYTALKQYRRAERYYLESVAWSKESGWARQFFAWEGISRFYVATAQYAKAAPYINLMLASSQANVPPNYQMETHLMRFKVDSALGNYPAAIRHYQQYKALNDSVFNEKKSKQIARLSIAYETGKKEQALRLKEKNIALLTQRNKAQQATIGQRQTERNAFVGGSALLLALLGLGYNRYHLKQRSNQRLEAKQQELQARQEEINHKNEHLSELLREKDSLLMQKDTLLGEKDQLLSEQERLLKEIHHRVKNNLQVIMSLLNSQAISLQDKAALSAIKESQHRVQAMALIHQKLYQAEGLARIPMQAYIKELVSYLIHSYQLSHQVGFQLEVAPLELDVTQAVPLGLILNEAVTNAFKYAFPQGRSGTVSLFLHRQEETAYQLVVADDGVGLPAGYDPAKSRSLGMTLMNGFSRQLGGKLTITSPPGLTISLVFSVERVGPILNAVRYAF